jgi:hypothetical protein
MKLKDILTKETYERWGDMDVANDVTDDLAPCWCGTLLTEYGKSVYKDVLELEAEIRPVWGVTGISVNVDHLGDKWEKAWNKADALFTAMAGYIDEDEYNKRFTDGEEESVEEEEPKSVFAIAIIDDETRIKEDAWDFPLSEIPYLLAEHEGETFVLKDGRLYEAE